MKNERKNCRTKKITQRKIRLSGETVDRKTGEDKI